MKKNVPQYDVLLEPCKKEGLETLKLLKDGRSVYVHSKYDPESEAERQTAKLEISIDSVFFVFGLGTGSHIRAIAARMGPENKIIVFEPNEKIFDLFMSNEKNKDLIADGRILIFLYKSVYQVRSLLAPLYSYLIAYSKNAFFSPPAYKDIYKKEYSDFVLCVMNCTLSCILVRNSYNLQSDVWFRCLVDNIEVLLDCYSSKKLMNLYKGIPAIIVSAGPSLGKNIDLLWEAMGKAVIIAVDTACKPLYNKGITPDFVISVDSLPIVAQKFSEIDTSNLDLVMRHQCSTEVLNVHKGRKIATRALVEFLDDCYTDLGIDLPEVENGGSVACSAIDLAYKMGTNPIILIGQDLAFTDNKTHVEGTPFYQKFNTREDLDGGRSFLVEAVDGGLVPTTYNLNAYREWIQMFIATHDDVDYIDATEGGAAIDGTEIISLREAIDTRLLSSYDIKQLKETVFTSENKSITKEQFKGLVDHYRKSGEYLKKIVSDVDACIRATEGMIKEIKYNGLKRPSRLKTPYEKIKKLNMSLDENEHYVDIIYVMMAVVREETTTTEHLQGATPEEAFSGDLQKYLTYYKALSEKIKYAVPMIDEAVSRGEKRLEVLEDGQ